MSTPNHPYGSVPPGPHGSSPAPAPDPAPTGAPPQAPGYPPQAPGYPPQAPQGYPPQQGQPPQQAQAAPDAYGDRNDGFFDITGVWPLSSGKPGWSGKVQHDIHIPAGSRLFVMQVTEQRTPNSPAMRVRFALPRPPQ